ncbi:MAG TPA: hypothetical protein VF626_07115 [Chthoniobacterales bacterium]
MRGRDKADLVLGLVSRENGIDYAIKRKTDRARPLAFAQGPCRAGIEAESESEGAAHAAGKDPAEERAACTAKDWAVTMTIQEQLPAVIAKISRMLAIKPEYFVTHPSELRVVRALSDSELRDITRQNGWRYVRRVGGRQIEFYYDAGVRYQPL